MRTAYICFCTDVIHEGHLKVLKEAKKHGRVIIGALSDEELIRYNKYPMIPLDERIKLYRSIKCVDKVVV